MSLKEGKEIYKSQDRIPNIYHPAQLQKEIIIQFELKLKLLTLTILLNGRYTTMTVCYMRLLNRGNTPFG